uniref:Uncharacterized protein n=1 Tax=Acrobeloides nanus TaxID=290746 RepID=A0A914EDD9_9BILA
MPSCTFDFFNYIPSPGFCICVSPQIAFVSGSLLLPMALIRVFLFLMWHKLPAGKEEEEEQVYSHFCSYLNAMFKSSFVDMPR